MKLRDKVIYGVPGEFDALWRLTKDGKEEAVTEYNQEITGVSEGLKDILKYGGNAYYWLHHPAEITKQHGWTVERANTDAEADHPPDEIRAYKHDLKSWVGLFEPILKGEKTHDLRVLDRDYQIGDICLLREYEPVTKEYTGREVLVEITYITSSQHQECAFSPFALHRATGILSIRRIDDQPVASAD